MACLIYAPICSLDGYVEDATGSFDWAAPDEEVHAFANDLERTVRTQLYGRRMWETMRYWETDRKFGCIQVGRLYENEEMRIVDREAANTHQSVKRSRKLGSINGTHFRVTLRKIAIGFR